MRLVLKLLLGLLAFVVIVVVAAGAWVSRLSYQKLEQAQAALAAEWAAHESRILEDQASWLGDPLLEAREGDDAAAVLGSRVRWEATDGGAPQGTLVVPEAFAAQLKSWGPDWAQHAADPEAAVVEAVDLSWMSELSRLSAWDLEGPASPLATAPYAPMTEPIPQFQELQAIAKVRLLQGLRGGDPRPAAAEVRELARLCLTTENLVGAMVGVAVLLIEARAHEAAVTRGLDVSGWRPVDEARRQSLTRVYWAANVPYTLLATGRAASFTSSPAMPIGRCVALREALGLAQFARPYAETLLPERYAALTKALAENPCRLRRARAAWASPDGAGQMPGEGPALCEFIGRPPADCAGPLASFARVSVLRHFIGATLLTTASADWLRRYREP
jgi:hypothetical protein